VILADTSVWIDHLRGHDPALAILLENGTVLGHAFVLGEIACGAVRGRAEILRLLADLPQALAATDAEVLGLIEHHRLMGRGIGYVDAHLLASTVLTPDARLWTHDRRLAEVAESLGVAGRPGV
jgi:hypothetical protein